MNVLIIEDESLAALRLGDMLRYIDNEIDVVNILDSVESSVTYLEQSPVLDLIFMDIELGDGMSFEIFNKVKIDTPVIFITAYQEYALKAFKQNSIDYLLKPLNRNELEFALIKYKRLYERNNLYFQNNIISFLNKVSAKEVVGFKKRFLAKTGTKLLSVPTENIAYFYTRDKIQFIKTNSNKEFLFDKTLEEIESEVDAKTFFRVNRQFIVNYSSIEKAHAWFNGKLKIEVKPAAFEEIIISRLKATDFKKWLGG